MRVQSVILGLSLAVFCVPLSVHAQVLHVTPALVESSEPVERALKENAGRASTSLQGKGGTLSLTYAADEALEIYLVPLDENGQFAPTDFLRFTLPKTDEGDVTVDLTVSPGWSPATENWILYLLTKNEQVQAGFLRVEFLPASPLRLLTIGLRHFLTAEPYTPGSYHALRGYRVLSVPFVPVFGVLIIIVAIAMAVMRKTQKLQALLLTLIVGCFAYQMRFSMDLLRLSSEHLRGYAAGTYDEAGSAHLIAAALTEVGKASPADATTFICRDGSSYKEKIIRYIAYPMRVSSSDDAAASAAFAVVTDKDDWSLQTTTENGMSIQMLRCGTLQRKAKHLTDFPDGSILFSLR